MLDSSWAVSHDTDWYTDIVLYTRSTYTQVYMVVGKTKYHYNYRYTNMQQYNNATIFTLSICTNSTNGSCMLFCVHILLKIESGCINDMKLQM